MRKSKGDSGFISIFTVLIIMSVLTLIAVGFSNVTRRAQRRTLDNQLSTQAFYAAESGVNDAKKVLAANPTYNKTTCRDDVNDPAEFTYDVDTELGIGYTCVIVNSQLSDIVVDAPIQGNGSPKVVNLETATNEDIRSFDVSWDASGNQTRVPISTTNGYPNSLTSSVSWGSTTLGMLRIDLAPTEAAPDRNGLVTGSYTFFLYPSTRGTDTNFTVNTGSAEKGPVLLVRCGVATGTSPCTANITLGTANSSKYVMRLQSIYNTVKATVSNVRGVSIGGPALPLQNGQTVVDVTGKAADVLRRIQVRLPAASNGMMPSFAIQSADTICKRLLVGPVTTVDISGIGNVSDQAACALQTGGAGVPPGPDPPSNERFPGDPNPRVTGKAFWGASIGANGDPAKHENPTNKSLSSRRTYWQWDDAVNLNSNMYRVINDDLRNNRLPFISIKPPETSGSAWAKVAAGNYDTELDKILTQINNVAIARDGPVWVVFHHEPEGGGSNGNDPDDPGGAPAWRNMQRHIKDRMNAKLPATHHIAFMPILMAYTWAPGSGRDPDEWWVDGIWNAYIVDLFQEDEGANMVNMTSWNNFAQWIEKPEHNLPYGTGEWGNRGTNVQAANEMQAFWNWTFSTVPVNDVIIHSYYDSALNADNGSWELSGQPLAKFREILKSNKVMRIRDL